MTGLTREPGHPVEGFLLKIDGYAEKVATDPLFKRSESNNAEFLDAVAPVLHCFTGFLDVNSGTPAMNVLSNGNEWPKKALVITIPSEMQPTTKAGIKDMVAGTFIPALKILSNTLKMPLYEDAIPVWDDATSYVKIDNWDKVLDPSHIHSLIQFDAMDEEGDTTVAGYLQRSKKHVYSFWPKGDVPERLISKYALKAVHLDRKDVDKIATEE
jgi:hypothetical protein